MSTVPHSREWYAERCAKMRAAKEAKKGPPTTTPAIASLVAEPGRVIKRRLSYRRWSSAEAASVAVATAGHLLKQGIHFLPDPSDRIGSQFLLESIRRGQTDVLPPERRRVEIKHRAGISKVFWHELRQALKKPMPAATPAPHQNGTNGHAPVAPAPEVAAPVAAKPEPTPVHTVLSVGDASTELLVATLVGRLFRLLEKNTPPVQLGEIERKVEEQRQFGELITAELSEIRKQVEALTPQLKLPLFPAQDTATPFEPEQQARLPRVAILGCRKDQFDVIQHEVEKRGLKLDLKYYDQDQKPVSFTADYAISMRWVRHHWDDHVKAGVPRGQFTFIRGGVGQVIMQLEAWFTKEAVAV